MELPFASEVYALPVVLSEQKRFIGVLVRVQRPSYQAASLTEEETASFIDENLPSLQQTLTRVSEQYSVPVALHLLRNGDVVSMKRDVKVGRQDAAVKFFSKEGVESSQFDFQVGFA
jgi:hypothetical protein